MYYKQNDYGVKYPTLMNIDNLRDLGGIHLVNGRVIRDGMIFRSGALYGLSDYDKAELDKLGLDDVFDLRSYDEVEYKPDYVPQGATYYNIPAVKTHGSLVVKRVRVVRFLFHCTAGKDRTGVASMLILLALGADIDTVKNDYMLSNFYRVKSNEQFNKQFEHYKHYNKYRKIFKVANNVELRFFNSAYNKIIKKYKTVKEFLFKEYNIDDNRVNNWLQLYTC